MTESNTHKGAVNKPDAIRDALGGVRVEHCMIFVLNGEKNFDSFKCDLPSIQQFKTPCYLSVGTYERASKRVKQI